MATTSNLWEVPISEEAPAKTRGLYGSAAFLIGVIPLYAILGTNFIDNFGWRWGYGTMFFLMILLLILLKLYVTYHHIRKQLHIGEVQNNAYNQLLRENGNFNRADYI